MWKLALAAAAVALTPMPAASAEDVPEWTFLDSDADGTDIYIRSADAMAGRPDQTAARMWVKYDARRDATVAWREARLLFLVNCPAQTTRHVSMTTFSPDGRTTDRRTDSKVEFIVPGTIMETATNLLCAPASAGSETMGTGWET